jgi:hypothetical protein
MTLVARLSWLSLWAGVITGGRVTIVMPHPDEAGQRGDGEPRSGEAAGRADRAPSGQRRAQRVHRTVQMNWHPADWPEDSPWMRMFENARSDDDQDRRAY